MPKFRKKPLIVEAKQWLPGDMEAAGDVIGWLMAADASHRIARGMGESSVLGIFTREGLMEAQPGDWVIREPNPSNDRRFYPCKADIFEATYEPAEVSA